MTHEHEWQFIAFGGIMAMGYADFICACGDIMRVKTRHV